MANTRMVNIVSMVNKTVGVKLSEYGINRKWTKKGQTIPLPYDTVEQMLWHEGFRNMIDRGILYIESMKDKIDLGLEPSDATEPENILVLNDKQIDDLLRNKSYDEFKKIIEKYNLTQINNVINYAILNEITDSQKSDLLFELTGTDVLKEVSNKRELERVDRRERENKANGRRI